MEVLELERKINIRVRKAMEKTQKEYYLREQMKAIQKELGDKDDRAGEVEELREKIAQINLPEEVEEKALKEVERLEKMPPMVAEAVVVRNYRDWILSLPGVTKPGTASTFRWQKNPERGSLRIGKAQRANP